MRCQRYFKSYGHIKIQIVEFMVTYVLKFKVMYTHVIWIRVYTSMFVYVYVGVLNYGTV